jgi:putative tryptophan/tyrosine transport system substrate-binding protein
VSGMADPVRDGLVASLARPGGNITGNTFLGPELIAKRFGLLKEAIPGLSRVAGLWQPDAYGESTTSAIVKDSENTARALGLQLQLVPVRGPNEFEDAFAATAREHADALIQLPSPRCCFASTNASPSSRRNTGCRQCTLRGSSWKPAA